LHVRLQLSKLALTVILIASEVEFSALGVLPLVVLPVHLSTGAPSPQESINMPQIRTFASSTPQSQPPHRLAKLTARGRPGFSRVASPESAVQVEMVAAIFAVLKDEPVFCVVPPFDGETAYRLPSDFYNPFEHPHLDAAIRNSVLRETALELGYMEQLGAACSVRNGSGTDGQSGRSARLTVGYLALAHGDALESSTWQSWYTFFPWEDWRRGKPSVLASELEPQLVAWANAASDELAAKTRHDRLRMFFGIGGGGWDEEKVLERFEMLDEADILRRLDDGHASNGGVIAREHQRCLATAMGRLRAKIKYRPVIFDLMPELFTLFELQRTVEAILGPHLHKQNFRRLVEHMGLVEPTNEVKTHTGGRPAKLFRFRHSVMLERMQPGVRVRGARA
jgi:hypothetical protein